MKHDADVIIIGAGIGGLSIGALMAHDGRKTLVLESNPFLGGRCTSYEKEGFIIDVFVHMIGRCEKGPIGEILRTLGRPDALRWWHATPDNNPVFYIDDQLLPYPDASFSSREDLLEFYRGNNFSEEDILAALKIQDTILNMKYEETYSLDEIPYSHWLKQFTSNQNLLALEHQKALLFCVTTLKETSAGEFIRMMQNCQRDANIGYPMGGCIRIPEALAEIISEYDGEVRTSARVERILIDKGKARGVRLTDGQELSAPLIISNAGIRETCLNFVDKDILPSEYVEKTKSLTTGKLVEQTPMGMVYLKLALDEPVIKYPMIMRNVKQGAFEGSRELMEGLILDQPPKNYNGINSFIPVTSNMDPELAPPGCQLVNFYGLAPLNSQNWQAWIDYHLEFLFNLYPEVEKHLMWYDQSTLNRINKYSGRLYPDIIGIVQSVGQTGKNRPGPVTPIRGLYLVGADVGHDNIGTELAAESAIRLADILL